MGLSVTDPIERAIDRTKLVLFQPFRAGKWFTLGFCAFLAHLGNMGGFNSLQNFGKRQEFGESLKSVADPVHTWVLAHLALAIVGGILALLVGLLLAWLKARGQFMLLSGVARDRGEVAAPWREFASAANRLFGFNLVLGITALLGIALLAGLGIAIALPDIRAEEFGRRALLGLLTGLPLLLIFLLALGVISVLLHDFVLPIMYLRRQGVLEAWGTVRREVLSGRTGTLVLYFLMKIVLGIAIGILVLMGTCLTCCCAALPYIGSVILLPVFVFHRSYSLCFLEQLGDGWSFFGEPATAPEARGPFPGEA